MEGHHNPDGGVIPNAPSPDVIPSEISQSQQWVHQAEKSLKDSILSTFGVTAVWFVSMPVFAGFSWLLQRVGIPIHQFEMRGIPAIPGIDMLIYWGLMMIPLLAFVSLFLGLLFWIPGSLLELQRARRSLRQAQKNTTRQLM